MSIWKEQHSGKAWWKAPVAIKLWIVKDLNECVCHHALCMCVLRDSSLLILDSLAVVKMPLKFYHFTINIKCPRCTAASQGPAFWWGRRRRGGKRGKMEKGRGGRQIGSAGGSISRTVQNKISIKPWSHVSNSHIITAGNYDPDLV